MYSESVGHPHNDYLRLLHDYGLLGEMPLGPWLRQAYTTQLAILAAAHTPAVTRSRLQPLTTSVAFTLRPFSRWSRSQSR